MSCIMRKLDFCLCKIKVVDQLCSNCTADQCLCFHYTEYNPAFFLNQKLGGPCGRVVKVADFSALNHSIISPLWVRASLGA